jgi:hypothetical protein
VFEIRKNSEHTKIIKNVSLLDAGGIKYESYMFLWRRGKAGSFRLIYNNFGNCTAWKLNTDTGIWGCFADQNDIGFDRNTVELTPKNKSKKQAITLEQQENEPTQIQIFERVEDEIADAYFALMSQHIANLFGVR